VATFFSVSFDALPNAFSHGLTQERGLSDRRLRGLVAEGTLERLGHGLHRKADAPLADLDRIEIALRAPDAMLCPLDGGIPTILVVGSVLLSEGLEAGLRHVWHRQKLQTDDGYGRRLCRARLLAPGQPIWVKGRFGPA